VNIFGKFKGRNSGVPKAIWLVMELGVMLWTRRPLAY